MKINTSVPIGPTSLAGWGGALVAAIAAFVGSHSAAEWKAILAGVLLAATNAGRHWQAARAAGK